MYWTCGMFEVFLSYSLYPLPVFLHPFFYGFEQGITKAILRATNIDTVFIDWVEFDMAMGMVVCGYSSRSLTQEVTCAMNSQIY